MRILYRLACIIACATLLAHAQQPRNGAGQNPPTERAAQQPGNANNGDVHLLRVRGNVSMIVGAGGNITVQTGEQGLVLVDTGLASATDKVAALIRPLSAKPVAYVINTDDAPDHLGGNLVFGTPPARRGAMVNIISYLTVLDRISEPVDGKAPPANAGWPNDTYSEAQRNLHFNGEAIQIFHQTGNTDGNSIVLFRGSDVVSTGDIFDPTQYPIIDLKKGGSIQGELEALNRLKASIIVPELHYEGGTMVIPGHGRLCDAADVAVYQQMVTIIRDRVQYMIKSGMTLDQVKAAKLTRDFDPIYGSTTGNWTTDMFVEAVYNSLKGKQVTSQTRTN